MLNANCLFLIISVLITNTFANYHGPFLLWGHNSLEHENSPVLQEMNERSLTLMYSEAKAIILFVRNGTSKLNKENFPNFSSMISQNRWVYLPQKHLPAEPVDYNSNVEVITLVGPASQQDIELGALYKDSLSIYGEGKVLGILSTQAEENHYLYKRETRDSKEEENEEEKEEENEKENEKEKELESDNLKEGKEKKEKEKEKEKEKDKNKKEDEEENEEEQEAEQTNEEEKIESDHIYLSKTKKSLLYTTSDPILILEIQDKPEIFNLTEHGDVITDERKEYTRLIIHFKNDNSMLYVRIRFPIYGGYWYISEVEIEYRDIKVILPLVSKSLSAPIGFSYKCAQNEIIFQNGTNSLIIKDFQVEPLIPNEFGRFSDAYDCVDFTTVPIWSGLFVTSILIGVTFIGILALMDIKAPNRFESSRSKQLTFTVQE